MTRDGTAEPADLVSAAAAELYGLPLGEFTAARAERARQARSGGDADAARVIGRLAKPTVVAWLANTLGEMGAKLEAGHLVMTGALHAAVPMRAGDVFRADFDRLGPVTVRVVS